MMKRKLKSWRSSVTEPYDGKYDDPRYDLTNHDRISIVRKMMFEAAKMYMGSVEWEMLRKRVFERDKHQCVDCGKELKDDDGGVIHHQSYLYFGQGNQEEEDDCVLVCSPCHIVRHSEVKNDDFTPFFSKRDYTATFLSLKKSKILKKQINDVYMNL